VAQHAGDLEALGQRFDLRNGADILKEAVAFGFILQTQDRLIQEVRVRILEFMLHLDHLAAGLLLYFLKYVQMIPQPI